MVSERALCHRSFFVSDNPQGKHSKKYAFTTKDNHKISYELCQAINCLHLHPLKLIHRDIKPHNVLVREVDKVVKLCDLGLAKITEKNSAFLTVMGNSQAQGQGCIWHLKAWFGIRIKRKL